MSRKNLRSSGLVLMSKERPATVVKLLPTQWVEVNYGSKTYLTGIASLLDAWKEKEDGKESSTSGAHT